MAMISIESISLGYGARTVVEAFSAQINQGSITAIVGSNGVGKSTLLAAIAGELTVRSGQIILNDRKLSDYSVKELAALRSVAQQNHDYWMAYTAEEILLLGNEDVSDTRVSYLVNHLGLGDFLQQRITELSGGQLQRIEISRAFMRELPIILLDEPLASQDLTSQESLIRFFAEEKKLGRTIVLVAHRDRNSLTWCDQIIDLN